jgi:hypothetical protein
MGMFPLLRTYATWVKGLASQKEKMTHLESDLVPGALGDGGEIAKVFQLDGILNKNLATEIEARDIPVQPGHGGINEETCPVTENWSRRMDIRIGPFPQKNGGVLGDVAPTILATIGLEQPKEMECRSLLIKR